MPTVVTDQERHRRVEEEGSKRKRDLAGWQRVKSARAREAAAERSTVDYTIASTWLQLAAALASSLPPTTYELWLGPLCPLGAKASTLVITAPTEILAWTRRRYTGLIREALHSIGSPYTDVEFVEGAACP